MNKKVTHHAYLEGDLDKNTKQMNKAKKQYDQGMLAFIHGKNLNKILSEGARQHTDEEPFNSISKNPKQTSAISKKLSTIGETIFPNSQDSVRRRSSVNYSKKRRSTESEQDSAKKAKVNRRRKLTNAKEPPRKRQKIEEEEEKHNFYIAGTNLCNRRESVMTMVTELGWNKVDRFDCSDDWFSPHKKTNHPKLTHLIVGEVSQTVKIYVSIALGAKIVKKEWIEQCFQEKKYVPEDEYLWENEKNHPELQDLLDNIPRFRLTPKSEMIFWNKRVFMHSGIDGAMLQCEMILKALGAFVTVAKQFKKCEYDYYLYEQPGSSDDDSDDDEYARNCDVLREIIDRVGNPEIVLEVEVCMDIFTKDAQQAIRENNLYSLLFDSNTDTTDFSQSQPPLAE